MKILNKHLLTDPDQIGSLAAIKRAGIKGPGSINSVSIGPAVRQASLLVRQVRAIIHQFNL